MFFRREPWADWGWRPSCVPLSTSAAARERERERERGRAVGIVYYKCAPMNRDEECAVRSYRENFSSFSISFFLSLSLAQSMKSLKHRLVSFSPSGQRIYVRHPRRARKNHNSIDECSVRTILARKIDPEDASLLAFAVWKAITRNCAKSLKTARIDIITQWLIKHVCGLHFV